MYLTLLLAFVIITILLLKSILIEWPSIRAIYLTRNIKGPFSLPLFGCIHILLTCSQSEIMDKVMYYCNKYERYMKFPVMGIISIVLKEPDDIQVILSSSAHIQKGAEYHTLLCWLNEGLLTSKGNKWHTRRKMLTPTFHFRILEDSLQGINKCTNMLVNKLLKEASGQKTKLHDYISKCALDIIGDTAMGIDLKAQTESGKHYVSCVAGAGDAMIDRILSIWQYDDFIFKICSNGRKFFKKVKFLHKFTDKTIAERKEALSSKGYSLSDTTEDEMGYKNRKPLLDYLIETQMMHPDILSDQDIREEVDTFMFEGHDTTSAALCFALWLMGSHTEIQEKVYHEIIEVLGDEEKDISMSDSNNLHYMEKVIKETLRLYPSVPYISRKLDQDCILDDGTVIPNSVNVVIIPYYIHRNPKYFPDPEKFDPERFSEENSVGRHPFVYIPFSAGPRNCIGQKFAMLEMKVTLAKIIRKLKVSSVTKKDEFKVLPQLISRPTVPLQVIFTPRTPK